MQLFFIVQAHSRVSIESPCSNSIEDQYYKTVIYRLDSYCGKRVVSIKFPKIKKGKVSYDLFACLESSEIFGKTIKEDKFHIIQIDPINLKFNFDLHIENATSDQKRTFTSTFSHKDILNAKTYKIKNSQLNEIPTLVLNPLPSNISNLRVGGEMHFEKDRSHCEIHIGGLGTDYPFIYSEAGIYRGSYGKYLYFNKQPGLSLFSTDSPNDSGK